MVDEDERPFCPAFLLLGRVVVTAVQYAVVDVPMVSQSQVVPVQEHAEPLVVTIEVLQRQDWLS